MKKQVLWDKVSKEVFDQAVKYAILNAPKQFHE